MDERSEYQCPSQSVKYCSSDKQDFIQILKRLIATKWSAVYIFVTQHNCGDEKKSKKHCMSIVISVAV